MSNNGGGKSGASGVQIIVALIGLFGVISVALIENWTEIFPKNASSVESSAAASVDSANAELDASDLNDLETLLSAQKFYEADKETRQLMLQLSDRESELWIDKESMERIACADLRSIDNLWHSYTDGKFGFTAQKNIFQQTGKNEKFGDRVGWRNDGSWLTTSDLQNSLNAPPGHLPSTSRDGSLSAGWLSYFLLSDSFSKASSCIE